MRETILDIGAWLVISTAILVTFIKLFMRDPQRTYLRGDRHKVQDSNRLKFASAVFICGDFAITNP